MQAHERMDSEGAAWHSFPTEFRATRFDDRAQWSDVIGRVPMCALGVLQLA